jgi:hypothetical protein
MSFFECSGQCSGAAQGVMDMVLKSSSNGVKEWQSWCFRVPHIWCQRVTVVEYLICPFSSAVVSAVVPRTFFQLTFAWFGE